MFKLIYRPTAVLVVLAGLAACAQPGSLDKTGRGDPARLVYAQAGTQITLSNTVDGQTSQSLVTAARPSGFRGSFTRADGSQGSFYPGCWACGGANTIEEAAYAALWPLETGKSTGFLRTSPDGLKARVVIRVAGNQVIETPAGTFETYLLEGRVEHLTGPRFSANVRAWWAPDPGWVVRATGSDSSGKTLASEVTSFSEP